MILFYFFYFCPQHRLAVSVHPGYLGEKSLGTRSVFPRAILGPGLTFFFLQFSGSPVLFFLTAPAHFIRSCFVQLLEPHKNTKLFPKMMRAAGEGPQTSAVCRQEGNEDQRGGFGARCSALCNFTTRCACRACLLLWGKFLLWAGMKNLRGYSYLVV